MLLLMKEEESCPPKRSENFYYIQQDSPYDSFFLSVHKNCETVSHTDQNTEGIRYRTFA